jgi:hypothetical protein
MNENERPTEFQLPVPRGIGMAALACLVTLAFISWINRPTLDLVESGWARWLIYAPVPLLVTFLILYRSNWHREDTGAARMGSVLLASGMILAGVLLAVAVAICVAGFYSMAIRAGAGGR